MESADQKLKEVIKILSAEFKPSKIYLFGSRGRGDNRPDSDYDLVLVDAQSSLPVVDRMMRASEIL